ncbi:hypothetical protein NEMBOFW57_006420 [Staphylotrichum longicolle]|uniref:Uncharacterized protein n=1 Tax=Staphylotrichum longicolle TaxID=669026 RepID=A0AAD4HY15_9PEZI|nr:hypothetical protein NEMBOFW57_006420 [Staphylotrichum longicolle]
MLKIFTQIRLILFVFIAWLYLRIHYIRYAPPDIMSASPEAEQPLMSLDEYITLCADLHNTLLAKSFPPNSSLLETPTTDLLQRYEAHRANARSDDYPGDLPALDPLSPLATLLSRLRTTTTYMGNAVPFTPLLYQPTPEWFFPPLYSIDIEAADDSFILLYPQRLPSEPPTDGGLFVDMYNLRGIWRQTPSDPFGAIPPSEEWLRLDHLLKLELSRWESGRYVHDSKAEEGLRVQKWVPVPSTVEGDYPSLQLAEALSDWERLLGLIESRLPSPTLARERGEPLRPEAMEDLRLSKFAKQFLSRARRPKGWTFVAPGIGTFSEESLREAYLAEPEDTFRRTFTSSEEGEDWASLVLPNLVGSIPEDVSDVPDMGIRSFDKDHGFGKCSVGRRAGLYIDFADDRDGDTVTLVLGHWANLVEDGVWAVDEDGVKENAGWFDSHRDLANLNWGNCFDEWTI